eukprot:TRINITY_DN12722_c0_g1_i1.p2 TRINITY_DN12722_c0_g1~~TRINITY_DN12722_c0_g1_i1.p2  ORF type:complete len:101 (+),score=21.17 TRINITY_DN12722_c0_g1_i1:462-764(+)
MSSTGHTSSEQVKIQHLEEKFEDTLDLVEEARQSVGTITFDDDADEAEQALQEFTLEYQKTLNSVHGVSSFSRFGDSLMAIKEELRDLRRQQEQSENVEG